MSVVKTALVIDDDADIREVLRLMLESGGFQVDALSDGIDAVHLTKWYDVILLDLKMPVFDGQRLTDYWQFTNPDILRRVIVLSGYSRLPIDQETPTFARIENVKPNMAFDHLRHQRIHGAPASGDIVQNRRALGLFIERSLDCFNLPANAPNPRDELLFLAHSVHFVSVPP